MKNKISVLVVGLLVAAQKTVVKNNPEGVDLRFAPYSDGAQRAEFQKADFILLVTKFISHNHTNKALQQFGRDRVIIVKGGASSASRAIKEAHKNYKG